MPRNIHNISYVILAGGRGSRMGGIDKGLMPWQGKPMIEHVLASLPQNRPIMISANRHLDDYSRYGLPVISDKLDDFQGPLAGLLSALHACKTGYLLSIPCDSPLPPAQLTERLWQCLQTGTHSAAVCHDGQRLQPLFALMSIHILPALEDWLARGERKAELFFQSIQAVVCDFSDQAAGFRNFNTQDDLA